MKSAYLIIAHNNFLVLQSLLDTLDSSDVDIYVHIDHKVVCLPNLSVNHSQLFVLNTRLNVRWGHVSQIETEFILWETACSNGPYSHYHLISGTHFPLKPMSEIKSYFSAYKEKNIFSLMYTNEHEIDLKIRRLNIFTSTLKHNNHCLQIISQFCWKAFHKVQKVIGFKKYSDLSFRKASNWCSLTEEAVRYLLTKKNQLINAYKYSFCGDEFFAITELSQSNLRETVEYKDDYLKVDFCGANPRTYYVHDYKNLVNANCLFARKFSDIDIENITKVYQDLYGS